MATTKADMMEWVDAQLAQDTRLREAVEARLVELRLERQLAELREARGLSQREAARLAGVSQPAIARLESGPARDVKLTTLLRMVTVLGGRLNLSIEKATTRIGGIRAARRRRSIAAKRR